MGGGGWWWEVRESCLQILEMAGQVLARVGRVPGATLLWDSLGHLSPHQAGERGSLAAFQSVINNNTGSPGALGEN